MSANLLNGLGANRRDFSERVLINRANHLDFDSAIPRFESWRPSHAAGSSAANGVRQTTSDIPAAMAAGSLTKNLPNPRLRGPKAVPLQPRPVTSWNGRVAISAPAGATPIMMAWPQPRWLASSAWRITVTLPVQSKV